MRAACLLLLAGLALAPRTLGAETVGSLEFLGLATIPSGTAFGDTTVGGLSGLTYDSRADRYYAISDDPGHRSASRFYTLGIDLESGRLAADGVEIEAVTILRDRRAQPFGERIIDGEGIALTPRGTLLISSEGNVDRGVPPSIREFGLDGKEVHEYRIPKRYLAKRRKPHGVRQNAAFESLTVLPSSEAFITANETALHQDGPDTDVGRSSRVRISRFHSRSGKLEADLVYVVEPVVDPPAAADGFRTNGLVELLALSDDSFLALERSFSLGVGNSIRVYLVATAGADNVRRIHSLDGSRAVTPVSKRLLIDLADLDVAPDNVEGMTLGPRLADGRRSLILVSDDNFNSRQTTQIFAFALASGETRLPAIQGRAQRSPFEGRWLADVRGVVTAVDLDGRRRGFWIQDAYGDGDEATADGVFVAVASADVSVEVGDMVSITGRVVESQRAGELPITRLVANHVGTLSFRVSLPPAVRLGGDGRQVPPRIDGDGPSGFDPARDAIDFYESLEGMLVEVGEATVVGPTTRFGTLTVAIDGGDGLRTARGGLLLGADDPNTERLTIDGSLIGGVPEVGVGRRLAAPAIGVLDYAFGDYRLIATETIEVAADDRPLGETPWAGRDLSGPRAPGSRRLTLATFNVENLDAGDPEEKFAGLAVAIATELGSPDLLALQEIQDDSGTRDDGTVSAEKTIGRLTQAVRAAGGPSYGSLQIDPMNNSDGGAPGGNIRLVFLYNESRLTPSGAGPVRLFESSPAFLADAERGFAASRKPLAAEFLFNHCRILAINVHLKSRRGDDPLFGSRQPPVLHTETQRIAQTRELAGYVAGVVERDADALVTVLGDFNDHEFRSSLQLLGAQGLINLSERVPVADRYSYNFVGNSQTLDHILVSPSLAAVHTEIEMVHVNADFPDSARDSDHDPVRASFSLGSSLECSDSE